VSGAVADVAVAAYVRGGRPPSVPDSRLERREMVDTKKKNLKASNSEIGVKHEELLG
jgi:hypothetical protein